jgi:ABC-2 type transport system ATP-binding protein
VDEILEITNLSKDFKDFSLKKINITLEKGYIMGFIGPNGSGKSTTIKLIMNLIKKDSGKIKVFGLDNEQHNIAIKERIGFVYDENHFYEDLTVKEMKDVIRPFYSRWDEGIFAKYVRM